MTKIKFLWLALFFVSTQSYAVELATNYVTFSLAERSIELSHYETSDDPNFTSLEKKYSIPVFSLRVGGEKEVFANQPVSVTMGVGAGVLLGRKNDDLLDRDLTYSDKVGGTFYSFGGTLNSNFTWLKMRTQLFGGLIISKSTMKYKLKYTNYSTGLLQRNLDYEEDGTQSFITAGVRFFDYKKKLFSNFSLEYQAASTYTNNLAASKIDGTPISIGNQVYVKHQPLVINIGFGYMF